MDQDLSKLKVSELREQLKLKGLNTTGNKQELIDRLQAALNDGSGVELDSKFEDDLLNDDELEEEKSLLDSTHDLLKSPDSSKSTTPENQPTKKVSLKRNISIAAAVLEKTVVEESKPTEENPVSEPEKKIVKITALTPQERLELRAKKFGGAANSVSAPPSESKLAARAARFGISTTNTTENKVSTTSDEVLKRRAERFGQKPITTELDKLEARKERFGTANKVATTTSATDYAEKARLRLERFKTTA